MKTNITLTLITLLFGGLISAGAQTTHTVCASGCDFTSIQAAIDAADAGDVIDISAGYYEESMPANWKDLEITKSLTLKGAGSGQTIIRLSEFAAPNTALNGLEIRGDNLDVHLEGITFTKKDGASHGPRRALRIGETTSTFNSLTMIDVEVTHAEIHNVALDNSGTIELFNMSDCRFTDAGNTGLYSFATIEGGSWSNNIFDFNGWLDDWGGGLHLAGPSSNLTITGGSMSNNSHVGFSGRRLTDVAFSDIITKENNGPTGTPGPKGEQGIGMSINEKSSKSENVSFSNITSSDNGFDGFFFTAEAGKTIENVSITGCSISGNPRNGIYYWPQGGTVTGFTIDESNISGKQPINLEGQPANPLTNIKVLNTTAIDIPPTGNTMMVNYAVGVEFKNNDVSGSDYNAIAVLNSSDVLIEGNEIYDNVYAGIILLSVTNAEVFDNYVYDNGGGTDYEFGGITMYENCSNVVIEHNIILNNSIGIKVHNGSTDIIANTNSVINSNYGVKNDAVFTMDATCNWWGTTDKSEIEGVISGEVGFTPWLISDNLEEPECIGGIMLIIDPETGEILSTHATIQEALDNANPGDIIAIPPGTYEGDIVDHVGVTFAPGYSPGCATIVGNFTVTPTTTFDMEVFGEDVCTDYDQIEVTGDLDITDATLNIILNGYLPVPGQNYVLFTYGGTLTGEFDDILFDGMGGYLYNISYIDGEIILSFSEYQLVPLTNWAIIISILLIMVFIIIRLSSRLI